MRFFFFLICWLPISLAGQAFSGGFSFLLPWDDTTTQAFLPAFPARAIGPGDAVRIDAAGHFEAAGQPVRFWGVNITSGAAFPPASLAPVLAGRMRKMGINLVRFHHIDNPWGGNQGSLFLNQATQGTRSLNPVTLDRLHRFIAALKQEGIYVNMNLHVSRTFRPADGVVAADSLVEFGKMANLFDPWMGRLQREYAQQLLAAPNPYTGLALRDDPVLAMVEITNENSLYAFWKGDALQPLARGGQLPQYYCDQLDSLWQAWLAQRYPSMAALAAAWNQGAQPPGQDEQVQNGGFESGNLAPHWQLELHSTAQASLSLDPVQPFAGQASARVDMQAVTGTDWHIQLKQAGLSFAADSVYALRFAARASGPRPLYISFMRDDAPYTWYAGYQIDLSSDWQPYTLYFHAPATLAGTGRITFGLGTQADSFWVDEVSLARPGTAGLSPGEAGSMATVRRIPFSERLAYTPARVADQAAFYLEVQQQFFGQMATWLRDSLGVSAPLTGTNALAGPAELLHQQDLDYIDDHSYWDHPWFPRVPWDPQDWRIQNTSLLRQPAVDALTAIFGGVAQAGRPYTVSEYNHPFPNRYQVEMMPLLTAYAALHAADGLMFFDYHGQTGGWSDNRIDGYFSIHRNPALMALSPSCAYAYRQGLVQADPTPLILTYGADWLAHHARETAAGRWSRSLPYDGRLGLRQAVRSEVVAGPQAPALASLPPVGGSPYESHSGEIALSTAAGLLRVATPAFVSVAGFLADTGQVKAGPLTLISGSDFGSLTWGRFDGDSLAQPGRSLLTLSAQAQNTDMGWVGDYTVGDQWGTAPVRVQPLTVHLALRLRADSLRRCLLDGQGAAGPCTWHYPSADGAFHLVLDQATDQTLWYGLEAAGDGTTLQLTAVPGLQQWTVSPVPAQAVLTWTYTLDQAVPVRLALYDLRGRQVRMVDLGQQPPGPHQYHMSLAGLAPGHYQAVWHSPARRVSRMIVRE